MGLLVVCCPRPLLFWMCVVLTARAFFDWGCWWCVVPGHYCCGWSVVFTTRAFSLGRLVVCCPRPLLVWWCVVLTTRTCLIGVVGVVLPQASTVVVGVLFSPPVRFLIGVASVVLSKGTTGVVVCGAHTRTFFDWNCWWCVVQGHSSCDGQLFLPPGRF